MDRKNTESVNLVDVDLDSSSSSQSDSYSSNSRSGIINVGKVPGDIKEVKVDGSIKIRDLFKRIQVTALASCEIQKNGRAVSLDDEAGPGDNVLAITKIRGN